MPPRRCRTLTLLCSAWFASAIAAIACAQAAPPPAPDASTRGAASGVWYEIFVRSWYDTDGDGIGDLNGVTAKLDYLKSLGVSGIWLMPINPSPSYHGYDVTDYYGINPRYGTLKDFRHLLDEAHKRHIKVIIDLVINHTSSRHPWFIAAADPRDAHHDWYSWARAGTDLDAVSATGGQAWHAAANGQHYLGIFTGEMPDLDYDTPAVRREMIRIGQFWLKQGVDGFRLDAAQHVYFDFKSQDGDAAVLQKNLAWWTQFRRGMQAVDPGVYIVGEVTQKSPERLAPWFKPLSAAFDFPLAEQLIDSAEHERAGELGALLTSTQAAYRAVTGKSGVDAPFLSNHDQERVMSRLDGSPQHMRSAAAMLLTLPGQPFVYYGEELGMRGEKPDPDLREPMRWQREPHGNGQTRWKPFSAGDGSAVSVEAEQADAGSLLQYYRMLIGWRRDIGALRDGSLTWHALDNRHLAAWELHDPHADVLVLHNLAGSTQTVDLATKSLRRFGKIRAKSSTGIRIENGKLILPACSTAILD